MNVLAYCRLTRLDVTLIALASYLVGVRLAARITATDLWGALGVSLISTNFIYSFNAWADRSIDAINKPCRPIPAGLIAPSAALRYSTTLLVMSLIYPFFLTTSPLALGLLLVLPVLGLIYSAEPIRLKRRAWAAVAVTATGLVLPVQIGAFAHTSDLDAVPFFLVMFVYCLSVVPLKDIEDAEGDRLHGMGNLFERHGARLPLLSATGLVIDAVLLLCLPVPPRLRLLVGLLIAATLAVLMVLRKKPTLLYRTVIWTGVTCCVLCVLFLG